MSDFKYNKYDPQITLGQKKQRLIDLLDNNFVVPEVAWDAQPVRYFKLNEEWCKILAGWLSWMEDVSGWQDAEDELHPGIQGFLNFEVGINGGVFMTPDEFKNALRDGLYEWSNNVAKQIVSGRYTNIIVDEDGTVSEPGAGGNSDTPDDPETPHDEGAEARSGEAIAMAKGFKSVYDKCFALYGVDGTPDTPLADAQFIMRAIYISDEAAMDAAVSEYYDVRNAMTLDYIGLNLAEMSEILYCQDLSISWLNEYILTLTNPSLNARKNITNLFGAITLEQQNRWILEGQDTPSTDYLAYGCVPVGTEEFTLNSAYLASNTYMNGANIHKVGHRILIEVSGKVFHPSNGSYQDFFWLVNADGSKSYTTGIQFNEPFGNPPSSKVPFQPSGIYRVTMDVTVADNLNFRRVITAPNQAPGTTGFVIKFTDLGEG